MAGDKHELVLSPLDEPASLLELRKRAVGMLPTVDLPELILTG
jgi:hypothetical protein